MRAGTWQRSMSSSITSTKGEHPSQTSKPDGNGGCGNDRGRYGLTAVHYAVRGGKLPLIKLLLERGAQGNALDASGLTPLLHLSKTRSKADPIPVMELLTASGANVDARDETQGTLLMHFARQGIAFVRANLRPSSNRALDRRFAAGGRFAQLDVSLPQSSHSFSGGSGDGSDDPSDTGKQEGDAAPIGILPKESKPKPCAQPSSEEGQPDNPCNQRHGRTVPVRDRSTGTSTPRSYHPSLCIAKPVSGRAEKRTPRHPKSCVVGPTHRRVRQPGRARKRQGSTPKLAHVRQPRTTEVNPA